MLALQAMRVAHQPGAAAFNTAYSLTYKALRDWRARRVREQQEQEQGLLLGLPQPQPLLRKRVRGLRVHVHVVRT